MSMSMSTALRIENGVCWGLKCRVAYARGMVSVEKRTCMSNRIQSVTSVLPALESTQPRALVVGRVRTRAWGELSLLQG